ncbi:MAG TPA: hypothetical protein VFQ68_37235 [Streptosporangiaceae bacterium]|nr:hypothetical protein [Streptosporangiaceae bacterium]
MADVLLNGRVPEPWEVPALERGREHQLAQARATLAGVLAEDRDPEPGAVRNLLLPPLSPL